MLTLTARHRAGEPLRGLMDRITSGWETVTSGWSSETPGAFERRSAKHETAWADYRSGVRSRRPRVLSDRRIGIAEAAGVVGWARAVEATHGANGWHVHLHVLVVLDGATIPSDELAAIIHTKQLESAAFALWEKGIEKAGGTVERLPGADLRLMHGDVADVLSQYLTKAGDSLATQARALAAETALGSFKVGRAASVTPFEMVARIQLTGDADDADLWAEWVRVTRSRKALTWSRNLRELAGLTTEQTDEEIAAEEVGDLDVLLLSGDTWRIIRDVVELRCGVLDALESGGRDLATKFLDSHGLVWRTAPKPHSET